MLPKRTRSGVLISTLPRNRDEKKQGSFLSYPFNFSGPSRFTNGKEVLANKAANFRATEGNPNSGIPGNFCLWNPKSWSVESGIQLKESGIPLTIGTRNPSSTDKTGVQYLKSGLIHGVESRI